MPVCRRILMLRPHGGFDNLFYYELNFEIGYFDGLHHTTDKRVRNFHSGTYAPRSGFRGCCSFIHDARNPCRSTNNTHCLNTDLAVGLDDFFSYRFVIDLVFICESLYVFGTCDTSLSKSQALDRTSSRCLLHRHRGESIGRCQEPNLDLTIAESSNNRDGFQ
jgi:hypothetical protein